LPEYITKRRSTYCFGVDLRLSTLPTSSERLLFLLFLMPISRRRIPLYNAYLRLKCLFKARKPTPSDFKRYSKPFHEYRRVAEGATTWNRRDRGNAFSLKSANLALIVLVREIQPMRTMRHRRGRNPAVRYKYFAISRRNLHAISLIRASFTSAFSRPCSACVQASYVGTKGWRFSRATAHVNVHMSSRAAGGWMASVT